MTTTDPTTGQSVTPDLEVTVADAATAAGRGVGVPVRLCNAGAGPVRVRLWVVGLEPEWTPETPPELVLNPGEERALPVRIAPPAGTRAGSYPWSLALDVLDAHGRPAGKPQVVTATLAVDERPRVSVRLLPAEVRAWRRRRIRVQVDNAAAVPVPVRLTADTTDGLRVELPADPVLVPAGGSLTVPAAVRVRRPSLLGGRRRLPWSVNAESSAAPAHADGVVAARPLLPGRLARVVALVTVLGLWAGLAVVAVPRVADRVTGRSATAAQTGAGGGSASTKGQQGKGTSGTGTGGGSGAGAGGTSGPAAPAKGAGAAGGAAPSSSAATTRFTGTVTGPEPAGVSVTLAQVSLVDERLDNAVGVGVNLAGGVGKRFGASFAAFPRQEVARTLGTTTTDQGGWSFAKVQAPGYYLLTFAKPGYQTAKYVLDSSSKAAAEPLTVDLKPGQGRMTGRVTDADGRPLGGATVTLTDGTVTVTTGTPSSGAGAGTFAVDGLSTPSTYLVSASFPGAALASRLVVLSAGASAGADLQLSRGVETITGKVTAQSPLTGLSGLGGATVTATDGTTTRTVTTVSTGPVGSYTLSDLTTGTWTVTVSAPGFLAQTTRVKLDGKASAATFDTQLGSASALVQGTVVTDADGSGIVGAGLTLTGSAGTFKTTSVSTPAGAFSFSGVPPGTYTLTSTFYGFSDASTSVTLDASTAQSVTLKMLASSGGGPAATGRISGTMLDGFSLSPIACPPAQPQCVTVTVSATSDLSTVLASVDVAPTSTYLLPGTSAAGLLPGLYQIRVSAPEYEPSTVQVRIGTGQTVTAPQVLLFPYASVHGTIGTRGFPLPAGTCVLVGKVTATAPDPIRTAGASCTVGSTPGQSPAPAYSCPAAGPDYWCAVVAADGTYAVPHLTRGTYQLAVLPGDPAFLPVSPSTITLSPGQAGRYDATLDRLGRLTVTVLEPNPVDPSGQAVVVPGATVTATPVPTGTAASATTGTDGVAVLDRLTAASYDVSVTVGTQSATSRVKVSLNTSGSLTLVALGQPGSLLGRVVARIDGVDQVVGSAAVTITFTSGFDATGTPVKTTVPVQAGPDGCFAVLPADVPVPPAAGGCTWSPTSLVRATLVTPQTSVSVRATASTSDATVASTADGVLRDLVVPERRQPVSVALAPTSGSPVYTGTTFTLSGPLEAGALSATVDASGTVTVQDAAAGGASDSLLPGRYVLTAAVPGYAPARATLDVPAAPTAVAALVVPIHPLVTLTVPVTYDLARADGAAPTTRVTVVRPDGAGQVQTLTDTGSGTTTFTFPGLLPVDQDGKALGYQVTVESGGYSPTTSTVALESLPAGTLPVQLVRMSAIRLTLTQVVGSATSPLPGALVTATARNGSGTFTARTGSDGVAVLEGTLSANGLAADSYDVSVTPPKGYDPVTFGSAGSTCTVPVSGAPEPRTCDLTASTTPTAVSVAVTVTTAAGGTALPLANASVTLSTSDPALFPGGVTTLTLTTDSQGKATFTGIVPTTYGIQVTADTYTSLTSVVSLSPGANASLAYSLSPEVNTVYVNVKTDGGAPLDGATVTLTQGKTVTSLSPVTGQSGLYSASNVRSNANYTLDVSAAGFVSASQKVSISGGTTLTLTVTLQVAKQDVVVSVTDVSSAVPLDGATVSLLVSGTSGVSQSPVTLVAAKGGGWTATFSQVPYGTYRAVYNPTSLHYGNGSGSPIAAAAAGADLSKPVTSTLTVDEYAVVVTTAATPTGNPGVQLQWKRPGGAALDAGQFVLAGSTTTYYLPSTDTTSSTAVGTWTVTATPSDLTAYVAGSATTAMSSSGPSPASVTATVRQTGAAVVTVASNANPVPGATVSASCTAATATTGTDGKATFTALPPGSCTFTSLGASTPLSVASGGTVTGTVDVSVDLVVTVQAPTTGGSDTGLVGGADVAVSCTATDLSGTWPGSGKTAADGTVTISGLVPGSCSVTATSSAGQLGSATVATTAGHTGTKADTVTVDAPSATVTLLQTGTNGKTSPVSGATIDATCGSYATSATTDAKGVAAFPGGTVPASSCTFSDPGSTQTKNVTLTGGTLTTVTLTRP